MRRRVKAGVFKESDLVLVAGRNFRCPSCLRRVVTEAPVTTSPLCPTCGTMAIADNSAPDDPSN